MSEIDEYPPDGLTETPMGNMPDGAFETPLQVFPRATGAPERLQGHRSFSIRVGFREWGL